MQKRIKSDLRQEYFEKFREILDDITRTGFNYSRFMMTDSFLAKSIKKNRINLFYTTIRAGNTATYVIINNKVLQSIWWKLKMLKYRILNSSKKR